MVTNSWTLSRLDRQLAGVELESELESLLLQLIVQYTRVRVRVGQGIHVKYNFTVKLYFNFTVELKK